MVGKDERAEGGWVKGGEGRKKEGEKKFRGRRRPLNS